MKKSIINFSLVLLAFFLCSFQTTSANLQEIFQEALSIKELENHLAKNDKGEFLPLTIVGNQFISDQLELSFANEMVSIVENAVAAKQENVSVLELTALKLKGKKSFLTFKYQEKTIKIRLKNIDNKWVSRTINVKWKNGFRTQIVSTEETHF